MPRTVTERRERFPYEARLPRDLDDRVPRARRHRVVGARCCAVDRDPGGEHAFKCPCHDSAFGLDGNVINGPSPRNLDPLQVRTEQGRVLLRFARFEPGARQHREV